MSASGARRKRNPIESSRIEEHVQVIGTGRLCVSAAKNFNR